MQARIRYAGIDEAGYGPVIGPLCVASTTLEIPIPLSPSEESHFATDIWAKFRSESPGRIHASAGEWRAARRRGIVVSDSKKAKVAASARSLHPLTHLERAVLVADQLAQQGDPINGECDAPFVERLTGQYLHQPWYDASLASPAPLTTSHDHLALLTAEFRRACDAAEIAILDLSCEVLDEKLFNDAVGTTGSKADVSFSLVASQIQQIRRSAAEAPQPGRSPVRIVVDRQGGRTRYTQTLVESFPDTQISVVDESAQSSLYRLDSDSSRLADAEVLFQTAADDAHFTVALASMTAKLVRELLMLRLNRYFASLVPDLRPTAGYYQDGTRFLNDLVAAGLHDEARRLRRNR